VYQDVFVSLLLCVLAIAVVSFLVMGVRHARRAQILAGFAYDQGLRFSREDSLGIVRAYRGYALIRSGHSPRASSVIHGHVEGRQVRAFDFRYEAGHGPKRICRNYHVVVVSGPSELPPAILWNVRDAAWTPLEVQPSTWRSGDWLCQGSDRVVQAARRRLGEELLEMGVSVQVAGRDILLCAPAGRWSRRFLPLGASVEALVGIERDLFGLGGETQAQNGASSG
jgi:hypothetical protein